MRLAVALALAALGAASAYIPFPDPPQPLPQFEPTWNLSRSSFVMPCNYTGELDPSAFDGWGIIDIDWSNDKARWVNSHPMRSEEDLVSAARAIKQRNPHAKVWIYRNLAWAPAWSTDIREKIETHPEWFLKFKPNGTTVNSRCTFDKCSDLFHSRFQTMSFNGSSGHAERDGVCKEHCDCGSVPCGWYLFNHHNASLREWLVKEHVMGPAGIGSRAVDGTFIDDMWYPEGPELEGKGSEAAPHDTGMSRDDNLAMMRDWRKTMDAANGALIGANGYTFRLFYNNWTCANAPFVKSECEEYMDLACSEKAPLDKNALFYGFAGQTGCGPPPPPLEHTLGGNPIIDMMQHLASFLLIRGPYAWIGWAWLGCGNAPYRPRELDVDYGVPVGNCRPVPGKKGVFRREWTKATIELDCGRWKESITFK